MVKVAVGVKDDVLVGVEVGVPVNVLVRVEVIVEVAVKVSAGAVLVDAVFRIGPVFTHGTCLHPGEDFKTVLHHFHGIDSEFAVFDRIDNCTSMA